MRRELAWQTLVASFSPRGILYSELSSPRSLCLWPIQISNRLCPPRGLRPIRVWRDEIRSPATPFASSELPKSSRLRYLPSPAASPQADRLVRCPPTGGARAGPGPCVGLGSRFALEHRLRTCASRPPPSTGTGVDVCLTGSVECPVGLNKRDRPRGMQPTWSGGSSARPKSRVPAFGQEGLCTRERRAELVARGACLAAGNRPRA